ncbi:hypothetical protein PNP85_04605 [Halobacterium salinarum]|uniref:hypothetical protein n=1 Tax=Halobacterium salinarum TaxID=2242 RepID=UPI0025528D23|nr:hypothetical protein [Halobacterium salinarum]MDL0129057.1 hypothetical protein [Halobacterium salinarum]MDL0138785.1 hypothetical protein [Halobacterium salinarum]
MDDHDLTDFKLRPDLRDGEEVLITEEIIYPRQPERAEILAVTSERFCVRPKKKSGILSTGGRGESKNLELEGITALRTSSGGITEGSVIEMEFGDSMHTVSNIGHPNEVAEIIADTVGLSPNWSEEQENMSPEKKWLGAGAGIIGGLLGTGGAVMGLLFIFAGVVLGLTVVGVPVGILFILIGLSLLSGSFIAIAGGSMATGLSLVPEDKEWLRE